MKKKKKRKSKAVVPEIKTAMEVTEKDIRKTPEGREAIQNLVQDLYETDCEQFPKSPAFDEAGMCRCGFENASTFAWTEMLAASGEMLEAMFRVETRVVHCVGMQSSGPCCSQISNVQIDPVVFHLVR